MFQTTTTSCLCYTVVKDVPSNVRCSFNSEPLLCKKNVYQKVNWSLIQRVKPPGTLLGGFAKKYAK